MSIAGYSHRGNDILGIAGISDIDMKPYSTLSYGNGEGYKKPTGSERYDISKDNMRKLVGKKFSKVTSGRPAKNLKYTKRLGL